MAAPKAAALSDDPELGGPRVFVPRGKTPPPEPTPVNVAPAPKSPDEEANRVLKNAFGPISPSAKKATASGRKHRTRKSKKHARKTKKHLRRK